MGNNNEKHKLSSIRYSNRPADGLWGAVAAAIALTHPTRKLLSLALRPMSAEVKKPQMPVAVPVRIALPVSYNSHRHCRLRSSVPSLLPIPIK